MVQSSPIFLNICSIIRLAIQIVFGYTALINVTLSAPLVTTAEGRFSKLYEPSGVTQLANGEVIVVDDEPQQAITRFTLNPHTKDWGTADRLSVEYPDKLLSRLALGSLDDVEAVAHDNAQHVYIAGSHNDRKLRKKSDRQKLVRFSIKNGKMHNVLVVRHLRQDLLAHYPELRKAMGDIKKDKKNKDRRAFDIEALAYDRRRDVLVIGLRTPLLDNKAILIRLLNADAYMKGESPAEFNRTPWTVDLDKGGLRALCYDDASDQFLMISRREVDDRGKFKLWRISATASKLPVRIKISKHKQIFDHVEGLTTVAYSSDESNGVLFVRDNGVPSKKRGAEWFILSREQLALEAH